jgi:dihydropteroate synthase
MQSLTDYSSFANAPRPDSFHSDEDWDGLSPITKAVCLYFADFSEKAEKAGIKDWILDPGYGFAKTIDQNYDLLREQAALLCFGKPILVGVSRKSMIYRLFGITPEEALPATQVVHLAALQNGADILRVHDVAEAAQTVEIWRRISQPTTEKSQS